MTTALLAVREHAAQQKEGELLFLEKIIETLGLKTVLELGTHSGGTAWFLSMLGMDVDAVDIDLSNVKDNNRNGLITYHESSTEAFISQMKLYDLIFIDANHLIDGVTKDWQLYRQWSAVTAFHDIAPHVPSTACEVSILWEEIKTTERRFAQWIDEPYTWGGIGVVFR